MGAVQMTQGEFIDGVPVQVLKPGKRSKSIGFRAPVESQIPLTTVIMETDRTAEHVPPSAEGDRRTAQERLEDEQRAKARAVAVDQPHRRGAEDPTDPLLGTAHGRFCLREWPGVARRTHRVMMFNAGEDYARDVRDLKQAKGFAAAAGTAMSPKGGSSDDVSQAAIEAAREQVEKCAAAVRSADEAMMLIGRGAKPRDAIRRLCCEDKEPGPYDDGVIRAALYRLALHYAKVERTINSGSSLA